MVLISGGLPQARMPEGVWRVDLPGCRLVQRFGGDALESAILGRESAKRTLALDLRSPELELLPGAAVHYEQVLRVQPMPALQ